jgi:hypothetical protein
MRVLDQIQRGHVHACGIGDDQVRIAVDYGETLILKLAGDQAPKYGIDIHVDLFQLSLRVVFGFDVDVAGR